MRPKKSSAKNDEPYKLYLIPAKHFESKQPPSDSEIQQHTQYIQELIRPNPPPPTIDELLEPEVGQTETVPTPSMSYGAEVVQPSKSTPILDKPMITEPRYLTRGQKRMFSTIGPDEELEYETREKHPRLDEQSGSGCLKKWLF